MTKSTDEDLCAGVCRDCPQGYRGQGGQRDLSAPRLEPRKEEEGGTVPDKEESTWKPECGLSNDKELVSGSDISPG